MYSGFLVFSDPFRKKKKKNFRLSKLLGEPTKIVSGQILFCSLWHYIRMGHWWPAKNVHSAKKNQKIKQTQLFRVGHDMFQAHVELFVQFLKSSNKSRYRWDGNFVVFFRKRLTGSPYHSRPLDATKLGYRGEHFRKPRAMIENWLSSC